MTALGHVRTFLIDWVGVSVGIGTPRRAPVRLPSRDPIGPAAFALVDTFPGTSGIRSEMTAARRV
jgi:hypothetical protein